MATSTTNLGLTKPSVNDAADIGVLNSNFDKIDAKCNPALFAPSGYGLGEAASRLTTDYNTCVLSGYYRGDNAANTPEQTWSIHSYAALVVERGNAQINQRLIGRGCVATRYSLDSGVTWQPWEYENPPMSLGVEYRTTERYQGKAVYTMLVHCGAGAVAGGYKTVSTSITGTAKTVRYHVDITNSSGNKLGNPPLEYADGSVLGRITISAVNDITMMCYKDLSATDTYCQLWYTKD